MKHPNPHWIDTTARTDQERADQEHGAQPPAGDRHDSTWRLIHRAIVATPMPDIPSGFAARIAAQIPDSLDEARLESTVQKLLLVATVLATVVFSAPYLIAAAGEVVAQSGHLPLPMLLASVIGIGVAAAIDALAKRHRHG
jgi:hypothetical protein